MNSFILKLIACVTMFIDHIGYVIFDGPSWFNYIGRLAFPIFAFQISEGFVHTKDVKRYLLRLFIFALISQVPFMLFSSIISDTFSLNVIFTLLFGLASMIIYKYNKFLGIASAILLGIVAQITKCDYGFYGVTITFLFYVFGNKKMFYVIGFALATIINYAYNIIRYWDYGIEILEYAFNYYLPYAICTLLSIIVILLYNKKKGPNTRYLLYLFYPLHLLLVYGISIII